MLHTVLAFDFDGTLTTHDTFIAFIRFAMGRRALYTGFLRHAHRLFLMKIGNEEAGAVKERIFQHFFQGMDYADFQRLCQQFAESHRHLLRSEGIATLSRHLEEGEEVIVISASVEDWVRPFFQSLPLHFACTQVEVVHHRLTGRFASPNCKGAEKVKRLLEVFPDRQNYRLIAFGDSGGDKELLAFADEAHYRLWH